MKLKAAPVTDPGTGKSTCNLPKLLLVGDSNAVGYCETYDYEDSLRKSLGTEFEVHVAAKSGTSWRKLAQDVHGNLTAFLQKSVKKKKAAPQ